VNFILRIAAFCFLKIPLCQKTAFSAYLHNYLTTIKVLGVNITAYFLNNVGGVK